MANLSDYLEDKALDHVLGGSAYTRAATLYARLFTTAPNDNGAGGTEVSGGSYAAVAITNNATNFPAASGGLKSNGVAVTFPTASASWGTVAALCIYDAATGGNLLSIHPLDTPLAVGNGDTANWAVGTIQIQMTIAGSAGMGRVVENAMLDHVYGGPSYTRPATLYCALMTAAPSETSPGTEPTGIGSYARVAVVNNATNFPASSGGTKNIGAVTTFPTATAAWGTITHYGFFDASVSGNLVFFGALSLSKSVAANNSPFFAAAALTFTFD